MKRFKKFAAVVLACVMALTLLTACGGGGGSSSVDKGPFGFTYSELVAKTNEKLGSNGPHLTYETKLQGEIEKGLTAYQTAYMNALLAGKTEEEADKAGQAAMGNVANYELFTLVAVKESDVNQLAGYLAEAIKEDPRVNNKKDLKTVGAYADLGELSGEDAYQGVYLIYVFVK